MKKKHIIWASLLAMLFLLALAMIRGQLSRELILKRNGLPLANLRANVSSNRGGATEFQTSTDINGRLDLDRLPAGTQQLLITLYDGSNSVYDGYITLPKHGSRTIDMRGSRTICTTTITYVDFGLFKYTEQEIEDWNMPKAPLKGEQK